MQTNLRLFQTLEIFDVENSQKVYSFIVSEKGLDAEGVELYFNRQYAESKKESVYCLYCSKVYMSRTDKYEC